MGHFVLEDIRGIMMSGDFRGGVGMRFLGV